MNIFCELRTYTDRKNKTQIENFTTESFKYILNFSVINKTLLVSKILSYFEIPFHDYSNIDISSQEQFVCGKKKTIPDLTIRTNTECIYLIEVKVDSKFNRYKHQNKKIDQVELYSIIPNSKVITLTKALWSTTNVKHKKCYWYEVYNLMQNYISENEIEKYLLSQYCEYLYINGMGGRKVDNVSLSIKNIGVLIDQSIKAIQEKYNSINIKDIKYFFEPDNESIGVYFKFNNKQGYCCMYYTDPDKLFVTIDDSNEENQYSIKLSDEYFSNDIENQIKFIKRNLQEV